MVIAKLSSYNDKVQGKIELCDEIINKNLIRGNVLVVDDLVDSGNTLNFFVNYLKEHYNVDSVKTAVFHSLFAFLKQRSDNPFVDRSWVGLLSGFVLTVGTLFIVSEAIAYTAFFCISVQFQDEVI